MSSSTLHTTSTLPARQVRWTRLGNGMGYTNTEPKRERIRAAIARMDWVDPEQWREVIEEPPLRLMVNSLFSCGRRWALSRVAVIALADELGHCPCGRRLVGLQTVNGERCVLLDLGYEAIDILHDTPTTTAVIR